MNNNVASERNKTFSKSKIAKKNNKWFYVDDYLCCNEFFLNYVIYNSGIKYADFCEKLLEKLNKYSSSKIKKKRNYNKNTVGDKIMNIIYVLENEIHISHYCERHSKLYHKSIVNKEIIDDLVRTYRSMKLI